MSRMIKKWTPLLLLAAVLLLLLAANLLNFGRHFADLREWIDSLGKAGPLVFVLIYIASVVAALPGSALSVSAGILFGSFWGVAVVSVGSTVGASLAFLIARYVAREPVAARLAKNERFQKLDRMTEQHGWIIVLLTRLVPIFPFNLLNYGFGLTRVRFWTYVLWSWIGMLPGTIVYTVGGDALGRSLGGGVSRFLVIALLAAIVVAAVIIRYARRTLAAKEASANSNQ